MAKAIFEVLGLLCSVVVEYAVPDSGVVLAGKACKPEFESVLESVNRRVAKTVTLEIAVEEVL